jgi:hypothetical protein
VPFRIELDGPPADACAGSAAHSHTPPPPSRHLLDANWERATGEALLLYVAEEPRVGLAFSYHGLDWRIVGYSEGWVAQLELK